MTKKTLIVETTTGNNKPLPQNSTLGMGYIVKKSEFKKINGKTIRLLTEIDLLYCSLDSMNAK